MPNGMYMPSGGPTLWYDTCLAETAGPLSVSRKLCTLSIVKPVSRTCSAEMHWMCNSALKETIKQPQPNYGNRLRPKNHVFARMHKICGAAPGSVIHQLKRNREDTTSRHPFRSPGFSQGRSRSEMVSCRARRLEPSLRQTLRYRMRLGTRIELEAQSRPN